jgi:hypothetical protein
MAIKLTNHLLALANSARPIDDADYGSARQIAAQNAFFNHVQQLMHPMAFEELEEYALKATPDEMINEALRMLQEE